MQVTDFWLDEMYMCNPVPLLVNSNPFFLLPRQTFKDTAEQVHFAAELVHFALLFRDQINRYDAFSEFVFSLVTMEPWPALWSAFPSSGILTTLLSFPLSTARVSVKR